MTIVVHDQQPILGGVNARLLGQQHSARITETGLGQI